MIEPLSCLVELEGRPFVATLLDTEEVAVKELACAREPFLVIFSRQLECLGGPFRFRRREIAVVGLVERDTVLDDVEKKEAPFRQIVVHLLKRVDRKSTRLNSSH